MNIDIIPPSYSQILPKFLNNLVYNKKQLKTNPRYFFFQSSVQFKSTLHLIFRSLSFYRLEQFYVSLSFMTLAFLKSTKQLCQIYLIFSCDQAESNHLGHEYHETDSLFFLEYHFRSHVILISPISGEVNFNHLIKVSLPGFSIVKLLFLSLINK